MLPSPGSVMTRSPGQDYPPINVLVCVCFTTYLVGSGWRAEQVKDWIQCVPTWSQASPYKGLVNAQSTQEMDVRYTL